MNAAVARMEEMVSGLNKRVDEVTSIALSQRHQPAQAPSLTPDVSEDEIDQALQEGKVGGKFKQSLRSHLEKFAAEHVDPIRTTGLGAIANLTRSVATRDLKYYTRFKDEIDKIVGQMPIEARLNPETFAWVHDKVVGQNITTILNEEREQILRKGAEGGDAGIPGSTRGGGDGGKAQVPSVAELLGEDAAIALKDQGRTQDEFARRQGKKDWPEWVEWYKKMMEEPGGEA